MSKENLQDILIVGFGSREHALGWKLNQSPLVGRKFFAPGNAGTEKLGRNVDIGAEEIDKLVEFAANNKIYLTIVGPETALAKGIRNQFDEDGLKLFGVTKEAARLESSKAWVSGFMDRHKIPHPQYKIFREVDAALRFVQSTAPEQYVIKADGLCAGKGVVLPKSVDQARQTVMDMMINTTDIYGEAGRTIVMQERLKGRELSVIGITDGKAIRYLAPAVDHKTFESGGQNTGGLGVYAPDPDTTESLMKKICNDIMLCAVNGMREEGYPLDGGVLYAGLMITEDGPKVLEFNVRFGDPETGVQLRLIKNDLLPVLESSIEESLSKKRIVQTPGAAVGVVLFSNGYPGKYEKGKTITGLEKNFGWDIEIFHGGTKRVNGQIVTDGGRVLCVTAVGVSVKDASEKVYSVIESRDIDIDFEGARYKEDIGRRK